MARTPVEPRKRPVQARSRATVERILDAAARIFDEAGYRRTTTNDIAERAGVSVGSLYQYFPNKDALLVALAERHVREGADAFATVLADLDAEAPDLPTLVRRLLDLTLAVNDSSRLHHTLFADAPRTDALRARLDELTTTIAAGVATHLVRLGAGGPHPVRRARLLVAAADAAVHEVVLSLDVDDRDAAVGDLADVLVHGLSG